MNAGSFDAGRLLGEALNGGKPLRADQEYFFVPLREPVPIITLVSCARCGWAHVPGPCSSFVPVPGGA